MMNKKIQDINNQIKECEVELERIEESRQQLQGAAHLVTKRDLLSMFKSDILYNIDCDLINLFKQEKQVKTQLNNLYIDFNVLQTVIDEEVNTKNGD